MVEEFWTDERVERKLLSRLVQRRCWGGRHTAIEHLQHGVPSHEKGRAKRVALDLIHRGWLVRKPTFYGVHVSLNEAYRAEIFAFITEPAAPEPTG